MVRVRSEKAMSQSLLVADDSVTIQRVFELTFADEDIRVIAVGDGQQAIERIKANPPDIVLADTGMAERNGYDIAMFIKADPALAHIPVVLLTGAFEPVDEDRARQAGCDGVLVKPFEPQVVIDRVRDLLGRRSAAAVPATTAGPVEMVPRQDAAADASTPHAETPERPTHDPDETFDLSSRLRAGEPEPAPRLVTTDRAVASDDPLGDDLERVEKAFDRFEAGESVASAQGGTAPNEPRPAPNDTSASKEENLDSLEGVLSGLEATHDARGDAKADGAPAEHEVLPSTPDAVSRPSDRSVAKPVPAAGSASADGAPAIPSPQVSPPLEPVAPVASAPPPASVSAPPAPKPVAPAPPPASVSTPPLEPVASAPPPASAPPLREPVAPAPPPEPVPPPAPVDTPPSLADAFASLLAAEQGAAERAQTVSPSPRPASSPVLNEALIDRVAERVVARLSDGMTSELVTQVVARVAEKLVRKEIERDT